ncbi:MAG: alanine--tRNA ligase [Phycisphaerae bacterium]
MSKTSSQIRQDFLDFFRSKQHTIWAPSAVIPYDDPTLLFTNAGMNQFKPLFLGTADNASEFGRMKRAANSQPCIRAGGKHNDLDDVGHDTYHHTFFEMLGNWSFGDYFKRDAIAWAWELITKVWGLDPTRLHATYFGGDPAEGLEPDLEARDLWMQIAGLPASQVHPGNKKDNFWEMGDTGPCGPCSEMHIDLTTDKSGAALVNAGDERVIEFWNLVFIQFNRGSDGKLTPLPAKHVDTGMGFERIARVVQGKRSNYDIDVFTPIFAAIQRVSGGAKYGALMKCDLEEGTEARRHEGTKGSDGATEGRSDEGKSGPGNSLARPTQDDLMRDVAYRVIADHIRTLSFAIADGCSPDKDGRGFVLRRILRRAVRYGWQYLGLKKPFLCELVPTVVEVMGEAFPTLKKNPARIVETLRDEEESFGRTLDRGIALFNEAADRATREHHGEIRGEDAFKLHDTYGFPIDLTQIMANEKHLRVDLGEYERLMEDARQKARGGGKQFDPIAAFTAEKLAGIAATDDEHKHTHSRLEAKLSAVYYIGREHTYCDPESRESVREGDHAVLICDRTCFYGEQGGQVGDFGSIHAAGAKFAVESTARFGNIVLHSGTLLSGKMQQGSTVELTVALRRETIKKNHIATHVLNWALRETLGDHIDQKGSLVDDEKTRFDFSHNKVVSAEELAKIESLVAQQIAQNLTVHTAYKPQADARRVNTLRAVFGEKYPDTVRVVSIGAPIDDLLANPTNPEWMKYSVEFCGGTHVANTGEIGAFVLIEESAVAKGIRRLAGITGQAAADAIAAGKRLLAVLDEARRHAGTEARREDTAKAIAELQKAIESTPLRVVDRQKLRDGVTELQEIAKKQQKQAAADSAGSLVERAPALLDAAKKVGSTTIVVAELPESPIDAMKTLCDALKQKSGSAAILLGTRGEKAMLLAAVTDDLVKRGVKAGDWIKAIAPIVEGGGGGPPTMAQAGGKNPAKLGEALKAAAEWVAAKL